MCTSGEKSTAVHSHTLCTLCLLRLSFLSKKNNPLQAQQTVLVIHFFPFVTECSIYLFLEQIVKGFHYHHINYRLIHLYYKEVKRFLHKRSIPFLSENSCQCLNYIGLAQQNIEINSAALGSLIASILCLLNMHRNLKSWCVHVFSRQPEKSLASHCPDIRSSLF